MSQYKRIGDLLLDLKVISEGQLDEALAVQKQRSERIGDVLVDLQFVTEDEVASCLSQQFRFPIVNPNLLEVEGSSLNLVDFEFAREHRVLVYKQTESEIWCAVADPMEVFATDELERRSNKRVNISVAPRTSLARAIARAYRMPFDEPIKPTPAALLRKRKKKKPTQEDRSALLDVIGYGKEVA